MLRLPFPSTSPLLLRDAAPGGRTPGTRVITGELTLPEAGDRPAPAVVISQGLSGVSAGREHRYARMLAAEGRAVLVFDSFAARARAGTADPLKAFHVTEAMLLADAFAALDALSRRPDIDSGDIAILGFSYGGMISVLAAYRQMVGLFAPAGRRFSRHVSYYGASVPRLDDPTTTGAPVTMLVGGRDGNIDLARTRAIAGDLEAGGSAVDLTIYPDQFHQWDDAEARDTLVLPTLHACRMRVTRDHEIREERTGLRLGGPWRRSILMTLSTLLRVYRNRPDASATAVSDTHLLRALGITARRDDGTLLAAAE